MRKQSILFVLFLCGLGLYAQAQNDSLRYPINPYNFPFENDEYSNMDLDNPIEMSRDIMYDADTGEYIIVTTIGDEVVDSYSMSFDEYMEYTGDKSVEDYWRQRFDFESSYARGGREPDLSAYLDTTKVRFLDVNPFGKFDLILGGKSQNVDNPTLPLRQRKTGGMDFDMDIQMGVTGSIADRLQFDAVTKVY